MLKNCWKIENCAFTGIATGAHNAGVKCVRNHFSSHVEQHKFTSHSRLNKNNANAAHSEIRFFSLRRTETKAHRQPEHWRSLWIPFFFVLSFHRDARVCWITLWNRQKSNEHLVYGNTIRVQNIRWWMKNGSQFSALFNSTISSVFWSFMLSFLSLCVCVSRTLLVDSFRLHLFSSSSSSSFFAGDKIGITRP